MNELNSFKNGYLGPFWRHPIQNTKQFFYNLKFAWQRATRGYSDYDLYDLNDFYTRLFESSLTDFRKDLHGAPPEFYNEKDGSIKKWENYLTEMAGCFHYSLEENHPDNPYDYKTNPEEYALWNINRSKEIETNAKRGLEMMSEHFFDLWD